MEDDRRWWPVAAVAPVLWGTTYYVTRHALPADSPLWGGVLRALPAGLLLLALARRLPRGAWWWRSAVLGTLTTGAFFALVYVAAQTLPTSIASTVMAVGPVAMMLAAWALLGQRPRARAVIGGVLGVAGVAVMLLGAGDGGLDPLGVLASVGAMLLSSVGYVLATRWRGEVAVLPLTAWQLVAGALVLVPVAVVVEGAPPALDGSALLGFAYVSLVATALANVAWFASLRRLGTTAVGLVGLLNPVTGVLLGTVAAAETLTVRQGLGIAVVLTAMAVGATAGRAGGAPRSPVRVTRAVPTRPGRRPLRTPGARARDPRPTHPAPTPRETP